MAEEKTGSGIGQPADSAFSITASDTAELSVITRGIWVGTGGDLEVTLRGGTKVIFPNVQDGTLLPIRAIQVWAGSTTASDLVGMY